LSAPQLFVIANDLTHMQILAQVGESDIAQIKQGQDVNFSVQALPNRTFQGTVQQVRLQSTTSDNVVDYTVVIAVANPKGELLPGMTARVDFLTNAAENVLTVSNAALRFHPATQTASTTTATATAAPQGQRTRTGGGNRNGGTLYYLDAKGLVQPAKVKTGITDGIVTQVQGTNIKEGMQVIAGSLQTGSTAATTTQASSPFSGGSSQQKGGGGPRGGF
jgi:HlyD family secretion protein